MPVTRHPPHRSVREELPHTAPTLSIWRQIVPMAKNEAMLFSASSGCKCCERTSRALFLSTEALQKNFTHTSCQHNWLHEQWIEIDHVHLLPSPGFTVFWFTLSLRISIIDECSLSVLCNASDHLPGCSVAKPRSGEADCWHPFSYHDEPAVNPARLVGVLGTDLTIILK